MKNSLSIFISSTVADLSKERESVFKAIQTLKLRHESMEYFGARASRPIETCLEEVRKSDTLIVIVGHRYGSLVPEMNISYTEAEYNEGYKLRKPILVYLKSEDVPVLPSHFERNPRNIQLLEDFKYKLKERHTIAYFTDAQELSLKVVADLTRTIEAIEEISKIKEKEELSESQIAQEINSIAREALDKKIPEGKILSTIKKAISELLVSEGKREIKVFLSYSYNDKNIVRAFADGLQKLGIKAWFDEQEIKFGESIIDKISEGLNSSDILAYFLSKSSLKSNWAREELNTMIARRLSHIHGPLIIPILLEDVEIPALIRDVKYLDLRDKNLERAIKEFYHAVQYHLRNRL